MSVSLIKNQILASLNAMGSLKSVSAFATGNQSGNYPFATLTIHEGDGEFADTARNLRRHSFMINVYQEQSKEGQGVEQAETIAINVLDELYAHLDLVTTLSGVCKYAQPVRYRAMYENRELGMRVLEIQLEAFEITPSNR